MRFISVRELRTGPSKLWDLLKEEEVILTLNGKPIAVLAGVSESNLQEMIRALRQARAAIAVESMQNAALGRGLDKINAKEIDREIRAVRRRKVS